MVRKVVLEMQIEDGRGAPLWIVSRFKDDELLGQYRFNGPASATTKFDAECLNLEAWADEEARLLADANSWYSEAQRAEMGR